MRYRLALLFSFFWGFNQASYAQVDTLATDEEEDYSMYDNLGFTDKGAKRFCSSKVPDLSPAKLISLGYEVQGPYKLTSDSIGNIGSEQASFALSHGLRLAANVPVISRNSIIVQLGANYQEQRYIQEGKANLVNPLNRALIDRGIRTAGLNTTIFKPLDEEHFFLFQGSADLNGDFTWKMEQSIRYLKYSAAALYGWKKNDRRMFGVGMSRTYRVGELNYIPVILYNYTYPNRKWGYEVLFPARAHVRRTFNPRSLAFLGYELEGQSYRFNNAAGVPFPVNDLELRRGELRFRAVYERSLSGFIWLSAQLGYRYNYTFEVDQLVDGKEFFRGFFGEQPYAMVNQLTNPIYFLLSINLVSP